MGAPINQAQGDEGRKGKGVKSNREQEGKNKQEMKGEMMEERKKKENNN